MLCSSKRCCYILQRPIWEGLWTPFAFSGCGCNEAKGLALRNRPPAVINGRMRRELYRVMKQVATKAMRDHGKIIPWTYEEVLATYSGKRLKRYTSAYQRIVLEGHNYARESRINSFVKASKHKKLDEMPRLIQFRKPEYTLELMRFVKPIQACLHSIKSSRSGTKVYAKGLNATARAAAIVKKMASLRNTACISADVSKWDVHVSDALIALEGMLYHWMTGDSEIREMLKHQLVNRGVTASGIRYTIKGQRMSGDANTALGNDILVSSLMRLAMKKANITRYDILGDGDDCLVFVDGHDSNVAVASIRDTLGAYGFNVKFDVSYDASQIEFCQARVVNVAGVDKMVRDWRKVLSTSFSSHRHYDNIGGLRIAKSIALAEAIINRGVPILGAYFNSMHQRLSARKYAETIVDDDLTWRLIGEQLPGNIAQLQAMLVTDEPCAATRASFERAWGTTVEEQLLVERALSSANSQPITWEPMRHPEVAMAGLSVY